MGNMAGSSGCAAARQRVPGRERIPGPLPSAKSDHPDPGFTTHQGASHPTADRASLRRKCRQARLADVAGHIGGRSCLPDTGRISSCPKRTVLRVLRSRTKKLARLCRSLGLGRATRLLESPRSACQRSDKRPDRLCRFAANISRGDGKASGAGVPPHLLRILCHAQLQSSLRTNLRSSFTRNNEKHRTSIP